MSSYVLPFEKPIVELENKLDELRSFSETQDIDVSSEIKSLEKKIVSTRENIYKNLFIDSESFSPFLLLKVLLCITFFYYFSLEDLLQG